MDHRPTIIFAMSALRSLPEAVVIRSPIRQRIAREIKIPRYPTVGPVLISLNRVFHLSMYRMGAHRNSSRGESNQTSTHLAGCLEGPASSMRHLLNLWRHDGQSANRADFEETSGSPWLLICPICCNLGLRTTEIMNYVSQSKIEGLFAFDRVRNADWEKKFKVPGAERKVRSSLVRRLAVADQVTHWLWIELKCTLIFSLCLPSLTYKWKSICWVSFENLKKTENNLKNTEICMTESLYNKLQM